MVISMRLLLPPFLAILLIACNTGAPPYQMQTLPSGKQLKVLGIGEIHSNGPPALMLKYQTDIPITDVSRLAAEADEIWPVFRVNVERGGFSVAVISANEPPHGSIITSNSGYNFQYSKSGDGTWSRDK